MTLTVQVVSPERILWTGEAEMVTARTIEGGDISFQPLHAPFVGALQTGQVIIRPADTDPVVFAVHGGFVEVSNNEVTVLSDVAEAAGAIDAERAQVAFDEATKGLSLDPFNTEAQHALLRAKVRLAVAGVVPA